MLSKTDVQKKTKQCCSKREDSQLRHKFDPNYAHSVGSHAYLLTPEMRWVVKKTELKRHIFLTVFSSSHFVHTPGTAAHGLEANRRDRTLPLQCTQCCFEIFFCDQEITNKNELELCKIRGAKIGMIFQEPMTALPAQI